MTTAYWIQQGVSLTAVAALVGLAALTRRGRPPTPWTESRARSLLSEEFPGQPFDHLWVATDGRAALAKSGAMALVIRQIGDGRVARQIPWAQAMAARFKDGELRLDLADVAAPRAVIALETWPPKELAA